MTFTATGPSRQFFSFTPVNDVRIENDELVTATLSTTDPQAVILTSQIQITIEDDDRTLYSFLFSFIGGYYRTSSPPGFSLFQIHILKIFETLEIDCKLFNYVFISVSVSIL